MSSRFFWSCLFVSCGSLVDLVVRLASSCWLFCIDLFGIARSLAGVVVPSSVQRKRSLVRSTVFDLV